MVGKLLGHVDQRMLTRVYDHTDVATLRKEITSA